MTDQKASDGSYPSDADPSSHPPGILTPGRSRENAGGGLGGASFVGDEGLGVDHGKLG